MMIKIKKMKKWISTVVFLVVLSVYSQQVKVHAELTSTNSSGLHRVKIPHTLRSYLQQDLRDFRIWDSEGNQIPYYIQQKRGVTKISNFSEYEIISKTHIPDSSSTYVFKAPKKEIRNVIFSIANYNGSKRIRVLGSENQKDWYGLVDGQTLYDLKNLTKTSVYKVVDLPLTSYSYLKVVFDDRNSLPINLLKIGSATTTYIKRLFDTIPSKKINISEVRNTTQIQIHFENPEIMNEVFLKISAPEFYNRKSTLAVLKTKNLKKETTTYQYPVANFTIRSDREARFTISPVFEKELYLTIENEDNLKLEIDTLYFLQKPLYVIADLKKEQTYTITAGDPTLQSPNYDLSYFRNTIPKNLSIATINAIEKQLKPVKENSLSFWQQPWFLWVCIAIAAIIIIFFVKGLVKDLSEN